MGALFRASDLPRDGQHCQRIPRLGEQGGNWAFVRETANVCTKGEVPCVLKGLTGLRHLAPGV